MSRTIALAHQLWTASFTDFRTAYSEVAAAGIRSVVLTERRGEFDLTIPEQAKGAGAVLQELGLQVLGCHGCEAHPCDLGILDNADHAEMVRKHSTLMTRVAELGCRTYVVHLGGKPEDPAQAWGQVKRAVDQLSALAADLNMALALENGFHGYLSGNDELIGFVAEYDHPVVGICFDSGHAHIMGDAAATLRAMSPHVVTVHLHDNDRSCDQHLIPGQGTIDWPALAAALSQCPRLSHAETEAANYAGWQFSPEPWSQAKLWERYLEALELTGSETAYG